MSDDKPDYVKKLMEDAAEVAKLASQQSPPKPESYTHAKGGPMPNSARPLNMLTPESVQAFEDFPLIVRVLLTVLVSFSHPSVVVTAQWADDQRDHFWVSIGRLDSYGRMPLGTPQLLLSAKELIDAARHS